MGSIREEEYCGGDEGVKDTEERVSQVKEDSSRGRHRG